MEKLLEAYDALLEQQEGPEARHFGMLYQTILEETADSIGQEKQVLNQVVRRKYHASLRANCKFPTPPSNA
ncbi:MAG: hypothetical protein C5B50_16600 [Verrucomicrobia bacterium]|nr:MAG: hypothetical protein C5B50_16600 [Verrucomicrobiota bacterium]